AVGFSGHNACHEAKADHVDRHPFRRPVAELAVGVEAPALDPAGARQRAGVVGAGCDGRDAACKPGNVDRGRAVGLRPVAELAVGIVAPPLDPACARERAGAVAAGGNGGDAACKTNDVDRGRAAGCPPVAELAAAVVAPALDPACARERAAVQAGSADGGGGAGAPEPVDGGRGGAGGRGSVVALAVGVPAPALVPTCSGVRAGALTRLVSPATSTGVERLAGLPSPTWP